MSSTQVGSVRWNHLQLIELASQYGTPLYVYQEQVVIDRFQALQKALAALSPRICFAAKANSNLSLLKLFHKLGAGFDIVSGGELRKVLAACGDASSVVFSGVAKTKEDISLALQSGILFFNVESPSELKAIDAVAREVGKVAPVSLRINPDVEAHTHQHLTTGTKANKFGMSPEDALRVWEEYCQSPHVCFRAIDCHIGSQITEVAPLKAAYTKVLAIAREFKSRGATIDTIDLGGGLGVSYSGHYTPLNLQEFGAMVASLFSKAGFKLVFEPGRFLVAEAGALLTRVIYRKENGGKVFLIVDAGMNDLMRPAMYDAFHAIERVGQGNEAGEVVDVVGPVCESSCYFAKDREMPRSNEGDLLLIRDAGAYGFAMSSTYNVRPQPAEVLLGADGKARLIRRRDSVTDLWRSELV